MKTIFDKLKKKYGSHSKAASALGLTNRTYMRIRLNKTKMKEPIRRLAELILVQK